MKIPEHANASSLLSNTTQTVGAALITAAMSLPLAAPAFAEGVPDRALISLKYLDYLDSQPDVDRIKVHSTALKVMVPIAGKWSVGGTITTDGISGASPAYHNLALRKMQDRRNAFDTDVTRYFQNASITVGANVSNESDYLSRGLSIQGSWLSENRNTTWTAGVSGNKDAINPNNRLVVGEKKEVYEIFMSVSQVLTPTDIVQFNLGSYRGRGYFSDPYKVSDNRPDSRNSTTLSARWNHRIDTTNGTLRTNYRYYSDSWRIKAHTVGLEYVQSLPHSWTVTPLVRLYTQSASGFYVDADPSAFPFVPNPPQDAVYFSLDQRLSGFGAHTFGLKIAKQFNDDWAMDIKFEQYTQRASWRLFGSGSVDLQPFYARSFQLGVARQF